MDWPNILNDLVNDLQPELVPVEFIVYARFDDEHGDRHSVTGEELALMMAQGEFIRNVQIVLDRQKIHHAMCQEVIKFFAQLDRT